MVDFLIIGNQTVEEQQREALTVLIEHLAALEQRTPMGELACSRHAREQRALVTAVECLRNALRDARE